MENKISSVNGEESSGEESNDDSDNNIEPSEEISKMVIKCRLVSFLFIFINIK